MPQAEAQKQLKIPPKDALSRMRFSAEARMLEELLLDAELKSLADKILADSGAEAQRRRLLADGLRITERIIPSLVRSVQMSQRILHMDAREIEIYVYEDPKQNACCMDLGEGKLFLLFSSSMVERMTPRELLSVIGHELGHARFGHNLIPARAILERAKQLPAKLAIKLMAWSRYAEISADRAGLLCSQDLTAANTALIKVSCGLREPMLQFSVEDYLSQMKDIQSLSESVEDAADWYSTHPFSPLRVVAMHHFWESALLSELIGLPDPKLSTEEMDKKILALLLSMEPNTEEENRSTVDDFLIWGGFTVAAADGRIDTAECASIRELAGEESAKKAEEELRSSQDLHGLIKTRFTAAAKRCRKLNSPDRHSLVQKLIAVAKADQVLDDREKAALREVCGALDVSPAFIEQILMMTE